MNCLEVWGGCGDSNTYLARPGLDVWICSTAHPGARGGGDVHLVSSCASGRITRMLLADVCGPGPVFSEVASGLRDLLKQNINLIKQTRLVQAINRNLSGASRQGAFAATLLATYFSSTGSFNLCNAGYPPPLVLRKNRRDWAAVKPTNGLAARATTLGVMDDSEHQRWSGKLERGDMALFFSNSLTECRTATGVTLGAQGLLGLLNQRGAECPEALAAELLERVRREHAGNLDGEDATVVLCRASEKRAAWQDTMLAPLRLLRPVSDKTTLG